MADVPADELFSAAEAPDKGRSTFVAINGQRMVGCVTCSRVAAAEVAVSGVYVDSSARLTGIGGRLLAAAIEAAADDTLMLWVAPWNTNAVSLYTRFGFAKTSTVWEAAPDDWIHMSRTAGTPLPSTTRHSPNGDASTLRRS